MASFKIVQQMQCRLKSAKLALVYAECSNISFEARLEVDYPNIYYYHVPLEGHDQRKSFKCPILLLCNIGR